MADADKKNRTVAVTNNDVGPRYLHSARGMEVVQSGATLTTDMSAAHIRALDGDYVTGTDDAPRWSVEGADAANANTGADEGKALDGLPIAKLRSIAEAEEVQLTGRKDPTTQADLPDLKTAKEIADAILAKRATGGGQA